jgi:multisubunit Na+/H+ antiporter MnhC subunit
MVDASPIAMIVGVACSAVALVLAWRAYRAAAEDDKQRKRDKERGDGR